MGRGTVGGRVALLLRSAEVKPLFQDLSGLTVGPLSLFLSTSHFRAGHSLPCSSFPKPPLQGRLHKPWENFWWRFCLGQAPFHFRAGPNRLDPTSGQVISTLGYFRAGHVHHCDGHDRPSTVDRPLLTAHVVVHFRATSTLGSQHMHLSVTSTIPDLNPQWLSRLANT